jgi:hypothetical protein
MTEQGAMQPGPLRRLGRALAQAAVLPALFVAGLVVAVSGATPRDREKAEALTVSTYPLTGFQLSEPSRRRFGQLEFLGGLELNARHPDFGGLSGWRMQADGRFLAVTDNGSWLTGRLLARDGRPEALADVVISPVIGPGGRAARAQGLWDSESIAIAGDTVHLGIERRHTLLRFDFARGGIKAAGQAVPLPSAVSRWPGNRGIEALGVLPAGSPLAGQLLGISERSSESGGSTQAFLLGPRATALLEVRRSDGFDVTDLAFLPSGDLVLMERFFSPLRGVAMRLRRVALDSIRPGAVLDGEVLLQADLGFQIDNMEALSIHRDATGQTIFTLVSDDNFSIVQRTLLLQFRWLGD